jgi:Fic family protein
MHRPPDRKAPPILFSRGTSEWIVRVDQKQKRLAELRISADQKQRLDRWVEIEFVYSTLLLEGADVSREKVARVASYAPDSGALAASDQTVRSLLASMRIIRMLAMDKGKSAELTPEVLLKIQSAPGAGFRRTAGEITRTMTPPAPEHLPALLENACQWYTSESFGELNPVEQASIVLLRLIDMQPFEQTNERTALVASSLFTVRSELPPIIIGPEMHSAYHNALDEGVRMNTKPMVELVAEAVERSIEAMLKQVKK